MRGERKSRAARCAGEMRRHGQEGPTFAARDLPSHGRTRPKKSHGDQQRLERRDASGQGYPVEGETVLFANRSGKLPVERPTCPSGRYSGVRTYRSAYPCRLRHDQAPARLRPLVEMLDGMRHNVDQGEIWDKIAQRLNLVMKGGKCRIEAAILSPSKKRLATCAEFKTMLGLRVHQIGAVYDLVDDAIVGRLAEGKRNGSGWMAR